MTMPTTQILPPALGLLLPLLVTARTPAETKRLARELNEAARKHRDEKAAADERHRKELEEQLALTRRLSERGRARRAGAAVAATASTTPTANVYDFYAAREARQRPLAAMSGARR
jgi:hypothetical protein